MSSCAPASWSETAGETSTAEPVPDAGPSSSIAGNGRASGAFPTLQRPISWKPHASFSETRTRNIRHDSQETEGQAVCGRRGQGRNARPVSEQPDPGSDHQSDADEEVV